MSLVENINQSTADMEIKIRSMLELQNKLNQVVDHDWVELNRAWHRAIWIECAELVDHIGWKWWKKQEIDLLQVKLELIDILHFGLSIIYQKDQLSEASFLATSFKGNLALHYNKPIAAGELISIVEMFAADTIRFKQFDHIAFIKMMAYVGMSFDEMYLLYIGKNVLNAFRQNNGYKTGTYKKIWNGEEDNVVLGKYVPNMPANLPVDALQQEIYNMFTDMYVFADAS